MKKIWKKILTVALAFSLVVNNYDMQKNDWIYAAESKSDTSISTSLYKAANITLSVKNNCIIFEDLPDEEGFQKMILVSLYAENSGETVGKKQITVTPNISYSLSEVADGRYYVQLYYLDSSGKKFKSYWYKKSGIKIEKSGNQIKILKPETISSNEKIYQERANSSHALNYYLEPDHFVDSDNPVIREKALEITRGITDDYEKVKAVHDWVAEHIWYDYDGLNKKTEICYLASEVLEKKRTVCQGYADLAAGLLRSIGIPTKVTHGYAMGIGTGGEWTEDILTSDYSNHAWNESYVNGRWVIFDSTWDSDNQYENGKFSEGTGCTGYGYFDPTIERFSNTHFILDKEKDFLSEMTERLKKVTCQEYIAGRKTAIWDAQYTIPDFEYQFESANEEIVQIEKNGVVTGKHIGRVRIKVTLTLHDIKTTYYMVVLVTKEDSDSEVSEEVVPPIMDNSKEEENKTPADNKEPEEDKSVEDKGEMTGDKKTEKPEENEDKEENREEDIYALLQNIKPSVNEVNLIYGGNKNNTTQIMYYYDKEITGKFKIIYQMEDSSIAKISSNGIVTAKKAGKTILHITYQDKDGQYEVEDEIDICVKAAKIQILAGNKKIKKGKSKTLTAKASNIKGTIKWKTSNKKIATVNSKGKVTARKKGKVTITAYIGTVKGTVNLTIY